MHDPDAGADRDLVAGHGEGLVQDLDHPTGDDERLLAVDVAEQHRDPALGSPCPVERLLDPVEHQRPVGQAGERVVQGHVGQ